jgi:hypothetical protein
LCQQRLPPGATDAVSKLGSEQLQTMEIHEERAESSGAGPSSRAVQVEYDVFISHCGADCKRNFAVQLKNELERGGQLRCFLDDRDLRLGDDAAATMCTAMETAKFGVVIVTEGFFNREWCIKELETFLLAYPFSWRGLWRGRGR